MKRLRRHNYRAWLERKAPGEKFCHGMSCPLEEYAGNSLPYAVWGKRDWREYYMVRVDEWSFGRTKRNPFYVDLTAKKALDILAKVA